MTISKMYGTAVEIYVKYGRVLWPLSTHYAKIFKF